MFKTHLPTFSAYLITASAVVGSLLMTSAHAVDCEAVKAKYQCPATEKHRLHLTFDDGVSNVTDKVLDVLKRENIKATFFVIGSKVDCVLYSGKSLQLCKQRVKTLERIKREGHDIGSHSYGHQRHTEIAEGLMKYNIKKSKQLLAPYFTTEPPVFRLPNGDGWFNQKDKPNVMATVKAEGFEHIGWEMTAYDWNVKFQSGDQILDNVMGQMCGNGKRGRHGVVVFHDGDPDKEHEGRPFTANNLERWIPQMRCAADFQTLVDYKKTLTKKESHLN